MSSLYGTDLFLWSIEQAGALREMARAGSNARVDWENVAEEIESLGRSDRRALGSHIGTIIEHLMKLDASPATEPRGGWEATIIRTRRQVAVVLDDSPSLRREVPGMIQAESPTARELVSRTLASHGEQPRTSLDQLAYSEEQVLGDWLPGDGG